MKRLRYILAGWCLALLLSADLASAETAIWSDNFDVAPVIRWQTTGSWSIGSPTAGPPTNSTGYRAHSGANCASTQNYSYNQDGRLVCVNYNGASSLVVPPAADYPRLRFWQWYNFANVLGYVEVSTNSGTDWISLSTTNLDGNGGGVWSRPYYDLSAYSGLSLLIAFHFTSGGCCGNGLGWFVDDVEVDTDSPSMTFPEGFEFDPKTSDWSVDAGTWEIGRPTSGPGAAHSGTNCAATVLGGNYANNVDSRLISPFFIVPPSNSPALRFWQWYNFNNALGYVEINNGGLTVTTVTNYTITTNLTAMGLDTNVYQLFGALITNYSAPLYWNTTIGGWTNATKVMGYVYDYTIAGYWFDAGPAPLMYLGESYVDYRATNSFASASGGTNYIDLQGLTWISTSTYGDNPIGYFGTNYGYSYTTNTSTSTSQSSWTTLSPTYINAASGWTNVSLDLSSYAGQAVRVAFHFTSGGVYTAPGWYVDDLSLAVTPEVTVPTNETVCAGSELMVTNYATNYYIPNATYTFSLVSPLTNMSISTNGILTWQTASNQPPSTNTIYVVATDNSSPPISATNSFAVTVVNPWIPEFAAVPVEAIFAGQTMSVTLEATNEVSDSFTYALLSPALPGLVTNLLASEGVLTWPTSVTQNPGTYTNIVKATDNNPPYYSATNRFPVYVYRPPAPVIVLPSDQTLYAGESLDASIWATNSAFPDDVYEYFVTNSPAGVTIDEVSGALTWATAPTNKSWTATISVRAVDSTTPPLHVTGQFVVTVLPTPKPTLSVPAMVTNYSGQELSITITATNPVLPDAVYAFGLPSASTNLMITNNSGVSAVLTWTNTGIKNGVLTWTNDSVAPRTNTISVAVRDGNSPVNSATNQFLLIFLPPQRPSLSPPTNELIVWGSIFTNRLAATNGMLPLAHYTLAPAGTLANAALATNGVLIWTNADAEPGIYPLPIKITDNSVPPLLATNNFVVTVLPLPTQLNLGGATVSTGGSGTFQFAIDTPWSNAAWRIEATTNMADGDAGWVPIFTNQGGTGSLIFSDPSTTNFPQRYYRAVFP